MTEWKDPGTRDPGSPFDHPFGLLKSLNRDTIRDASSRIVFPLPVTISTCEDVKSGSHTRTEIAIQHFEPALGTGGHRR